MVEPFNMPQPGQVPQPGLVPQPGQAGFLYEDMAPTATILDPENTVFLKKNQFKITRNCSE